MKIYDRGSYHIIEVSNKRLLVTDTAVRFLKDDEFPIQENENTVPADVTLQGRLENATMNYFSILNVEQLAMLQIFVQDAIDNFE